MAFFTAPWMADNFDWGDFFFILLIDMRERSRIVTFVIKFSTAKRILIVNMRRFTRLTNGFSKEAESHEYVLAVHYMFYNFARVYQTLRVSPAMEVGVSDRLWENSISWPCLISRQTEPLPTV
jgi:hypothetical protein